jgi:hypothetical protein
VLTIGKADIEHLPVQFLDVHVLDASMNCFPFVRVLVTISYDKFFDVFDLLGLAEPSQNIVDLGVRLIVVRTRVWKLWEFSNH